MICLAGVTSVSGDEHGTGDLVGCGEIAGSPGALWNTWVRFAPSWHARYAISGHAELLLT
jgi:hypothetical protein